MYSNSLNEEGGTTCGQQSVWAVYGCRKQQVEKVVATLRKKTWKINSP